MTNSTRAYVKTLIAVTVWGVSFVATKLAVAEIAPMSVVWLRFGIGTIVIGVILLQRKERPAVAARDIPFLVLLGFLGITFHQWLQANGLVTAGATASSWIVTTIPVFTAILGSFLLRERLGTKRWMGIALAAAGVALVITKGDFGTMLSGGAVNSGDLLVLLSAPNWAVFSVLSRKALGTRSPAVMLFLVMLFGWLLSFPLFLAGGGFADVARLSMHGGIGIAFLGVLCSGIAYIYYYDALKVLPAARVSALIYLEPFVTVVTAALLLGEPLLPSMFLGGALILAGVWQVR